jgi:hypothetical protein
VDAFRDRNWKKGFAIMKFTALATALALVAATSPAVAAPRAATNSAASLSVGNAPAVRAATKTRNASHVSVLENPFVSVVMGVVAVGGILLIAGAVANDDDTADSN